jgi:hypothetical protein
MNASEFVDWSRAAFMSFSAAELYQACAFSTLSNEIMAKRSGGPPSRLAAEFHQVSSIS